MLLEESSGVTKTNRNFMEIWPEDILLWTKSWPEAVMWLGQEVSANMPASQNTSDWVCVGYEHLPPGVILLNFFMADILTCRSSTTGNTEVSQQCSLC